VASGRETYGAFLERYPAYRETATLDALRASDYHRLDAQQHVYLDSTGAALYAESQIRAHQELLNHHIFGNPHSASPASSEMTHLVEHTRGAVLAWFNADPAEYTAIFTANATGALKLVGESYPFAPNGRCLLTFDNHNSVNGIREFAGAAGSAVVYAPLTVPDLRIDLPRLEALLRTGGAGPKLFAFPAQSNFSGVQHPLDLVDEARRLGWDVLLDAAAFVPTSRLDLRAITPDFVSVSFYKMFGYPTGVGCLIVRREALARLRRPWFAGGTVNFASVQGQRHVLARAEAGFEDGTLNYAAIPAVELGLRHLGAIGLETIALRVRCLTGWLIDQSMALRHSNGRPMVRLYGPATTEMRGGIVTMNFYDPDGHLLDYRRVEELAGLQRISLRTGCFCNPGAAEVAEGLTEADMAASVEAGAEISLPRFLQIITHRSGKSAGAIRVSLGLVTNFADIDRFLQCAESLRDQTRLTMGEVTFDIETCRVIRDGA